MKHLEKHLEKEAELRQSGAVQVLTNQAFYSLSMSFPDLSDKKVCNLFIDMFNRYKQEIALAKRMKD